MTASPNGDRETAKPDTATSAGRDAPSSAPASFSVCPYLAGGDGSWRSAQPTKSHVCGAVEPPAALTTTKQRQLCLTSSHEGCATYRAASAIVGSSAPDPLDASLWPATTPRVVAVDPIRTGLAGGLTSPQAKVGGQAVLVGLIIVAFAVLVVARSSAPGGAIPLASPGLPASPSAAVPAGAGASASPSPATTGAPVASAGATAAPQPTATPAGERKYKVKRGDTLSSIAAKFGVTVKAIRKANGLATDDVIRRGQVLIIPAPRASAIP